MRILISIAVGLGIGVLFLVDVLGWISWCPNGVLEFLHYPSMLLEDTLFQRSSVFWGSLSLATLQWPLIGVLVGLVLQLTRKAANPGLQGTSDSASGSNSGTSGPVPLS